MMLFCAIMIYLNYHTLELRFSKDFQSMLFLKNGIMLATLYIMKIKSPLDMLFAIFYAKRYKTESSHKHNYATKLQEFLFFIFYFLYLYFIFIFINLILLFLSLLILYSLSVRFLKQLSLPLYFILFITRCSLSRPYDPCSGRRPRLLYHCTLNM